VNASLQSLAEGMAELVALMKRQVEQVDLSLAMKRVELSTFLLIDVTRQVDSRKQEREMMEQSIASTEEQINDMNDVLPKDSPDASLEELQEQRKFIARMETALAQQKEQVKRLDLQLVEYENQAASHRDEISRWQDVVDDYFQNRKP
jgi:chromosome segregation ATPase